MNVILIYQSGALSFYWVNEYVQTNFVIFLKCFKVSLQRFTKVQSHIYVHIMFLTIISYYRCKNLQEVIIWVYINSNRKKKSSVIVNKMALHYIISPISDTTSLIIWPITSNLVFYFTRNINNGFKFVVGEASPQYIVNSFNNLRYKNLSTEFLIYSFHLVHLFYRSSLFGNGENMVTI